MPTRDTAAAAAAAAAAEVAKQVAATAAIAASKVAETSTAQSLQIASVAQDISYIKGEVSGVTKTISDGFAAVHSRQDVSNGRIGKTEHGLLVLQTNVKAKTVYTNILWFLITALVGMVVFFVSGK